MAYFTLSVIDNSGRRTRVRREAESAEILLGQLSRTGMYAISPVHELRGRGKFRKDLRLKRKNVELFTDSLSVMLTSGLSVKDALTIIASSSSSGKEPQLAQAILVRINSGASFAMALSSAVPDFPSLYLALIRIGEQVGSLESVLAALSLYLHDERKIREKVSQSLLYPTLVLTTAFVGVILFLVLLIPRITAMIAELGASALGRLESTLRNVRIGFSLSGSALFLLFLVVVILYIVRKFNTHMRERIDRFLLRLPLLGSVLLRKELVNLAFAVEILTINGVPIETAMEESSLVVANFALRADIAGIRDELRKGEHLSTAFSRRTLFPDRIRLWVRIGEQTGTVEKVFHQIRVAYQAELEASSARILSLVEPVATLVAGLAILVLVLTVVVPLFELLGTLI